MSTYAQIILPLRLKWTPWYLCEEAPCPGDRVLVSFAGKEYVGVVRAVSDTPGIDPSKIKPVLRMMPELPSITDRELSLWKFISEYYLCTIGEVYKAAYPTFRLKSEKTAARRPAVESGDIRQSARKETGRRDASAHPVLICGRDRFYTYTKKISACLQDGFDALVMVPESSLGEIMTEKLSTQYKDRIIEFNPKMTPVQRRRSADAARDTAREPSVIVGTRVALFLPFSRLGLVIVDEEQDSSYKQTEPAPRYNARDCAIVLAGLHGAETVLGSAFPSLESLNNSIEGKYSRLDLCEASPNVEIIDLAAEKRKRGVVGLFSFRMIEAIKNFPGPVALVRGWENEQELVEEVVKFFPGKEMEILNAAAARKGIGKDRLCAVLQADAFFEKDRFRSDEHCLQQLSQFGQDAAAMVVQTSKSSHPVFDALSGAVNDAALKMLEERKSFRLPPYSRTIDLLSRFADNADELQGRLESLEALRNDKVLIQRTGPATVRVILPRDSSLRSRKTAIGEAAELSGAVADVDPL